jgi:hypothetical protein
MSKSSEELWSSFYGQETELDGYSETLVHALHVIRRHNAETSKSGNGITLFIEYKKIGSQQNISLNIYSNLHITLFDQSQN